MEDFWIDVLLAITVTVLTVLADLLANRLVSSTRRMARIKRVLEQTAAESDKITQIQEQVQIYYASRIASLTWGSDLAGIALSLDLAILGVWVGNPAMFPFFSKFNTADGSRELPVWLIVIFTHFLLLLGSIALKHIHADTVESTPLLRWTTGARMEWLSRYRHMFASNLIGFISLLSSLVVITNAI